MDNAALDMPGEFLTRLNDIMKDWAASGASVLYLTTERAGSEEKYKKEKSGCDFTEEKMWSETVSRLKELNPDDDPPAGGPSL
ncbi:MAG: hypothetical protein GY771_07985 [bacterium]|nr:hypothetical protein [bacterium]